MTRLPFPSLLSALLWALLLAPLAACDIDHNAPVENRLPAPGEIIGDRGGGAPAFRPIQGPAAFRTGNPAASPHY